MPGAASTVFFCVAESVGRALGQAQLCVVYGSERLPATLQQAFGHCSHESPQVLLDLKSGSTFEFELGLQHVTARYVRPGVCKHALNFHQVFEIFRRIFSEGAMRPVILWILDCRFALRCAACVKIEKRLKCTNEP